MNEDQAFNFMVETYQQYKAGELSEEHLIKMNSLLGEDWIKHTENELIEMGLQYHNILQEYQESE